MNNVTPLLRGPLPAANDGQTTRPAPTADWSLCTALDEVTRLWTSTDNALHSAREGLYEFLGATYEHAARLSGNAAALDDLRATVRRQYASDAQKRRAERASPAELLLAAALGLEQASLRSKYKRLLARADDGGVPADRASFKGWLRKTGGIVDAFGAAIEAPAPKTPLQSGPRSFESCAGDLLRHLDSKPVETRSFAKEPYQRFAIVLYYVDPRTTQAFTVSELTDSDLIERAVRIASEDQARSAREQEAA
jgi:hypothetical protein